MVKQAAKFQTGEFEIPALSKQPAGKKTSVINFAEAAGPGLRHQALLIGFKFLFHVESSSEQLGELCLPLQTTHNISKVGHS